MAGFERTGESSPDGGDRCRNDVLDDVTLPSRVVNRLEMDCASESR